MNFKNLITFIFVIKVSLFYSQCSPKDYKTFNDSLFSNNDKVLCPTIVYNEPNGFRILTEQSDTTLTIIADFIKKHEHIKFEIGSHTDQRGSEKMNLISSEYRAKSIKDYLIRKHQIDSSRLLAKGYGESKPIVSIDLIEEESNKRRQEEMYRCNRRTELTIIKD